MIPWLPRRLITHLCLVKLALMVPFFVHFASAAVTIETRNSCVTVLTATTGSRLSFAVPVTTADWIEVIDHLRSNELFPNQSLSTNVLRAADFLTPADRAFLLQILVRDYRSLKKAPNRRSVDLLFNRLFRPDLLFLERQARGMSVAEAFDLTMQETRAAIGDEHNYDFNDITGVAKAIQKKLGRNDVVYLVGSAPQGRAAISKSDFDIRFEHPKSNFYLWSQETLPYSIRKLFIYLFEGQLRRVTQEALINAHPQPHRHLVEVFDITPDSVSRSGEWMAHGKTNPFIVEVRSHTIDLVVFAPAPTADKPGPYQRFKLF